MTADEIRASLDQVISNFKNSASKATGYCGTGSACYAVSETQKAFISALEEIRDILVSDKMES